MPKSKLTDRQISRIVKLYRNNRVPMDLLCKMFEVSDDTVLRAMKKEGVPRRITVGFCGKENSNWRGGYSLHFAKNLAIRTLKKNKCVVCGYKISTDVHHWDENRKNNKPNNLALLCPNHHREVHLGFITRENIRNIS